MAVSSQSGDKGIPPREAADSGSEPIPANETLLALSTPFEHVSHSSAPCPVCGETLRGYWVVCPCCQTSTHRNCEVCGAEVRPFWEPCLRCRRTVTPTRKLVHASTPAAEPGPEAFSSPLNGMEFVWISPGRFHMGGAIEEDERPTHTVRLSKGFWLGRYPVTQQEWIDVMGANPSHFKGARRPVENLSWKDAQRFLDRWNQRGEGRYRLPTEAEWEYACRAGRRARWSFGNDEEKLAEYAWFLRNSARQTHDVGQKKPNPWGLHDMHGNVWEWCADWLGPYSAGAGLDPAGPLMGQFRVLRGGSWYCGASESRCAYRDGEKPEGRLNSIGLRVVRDA